MEEQSGMKGGMEAKSNRCFLIWAYTHMHQRTCTHVYHAFQVDLNFKDKIEKSKDKKYKSLFPIWELCACMSLCVCEAVYLCPLPVSPLRLFSRVTPLSSTTLCLSPTSSRCLWIAWATDIKGQTYEVR